MAHWVQDLLGMFETTDDPRLSRWVPRLHTCEGPAEFCFRGGGGWVGGSKRGGWVGLCPPPPPPPSRRP